MKGRQASMLYACITLCKYSLGMFGGLYDLKEEEKQNDFGLRIKRKRKLTYNLEKRCSLSLSLSLSFVLS